MGKVVTIVKLFPNEGVTAEAVLAEARKLVECTDARVEEIAFGAKCVRCSFVCEDSEGKDFEEIGRGIRGVSEVQVEDVGLV
jgi:translation elongation factor EF-1beta